MSINSRNGNTLLDGGFFAPVRAAATAPIVLSGLQTIDTIVLAEGDRVLVAGQADQTTNGIYAAASGNWVRTTDAAGNTDFFSGMAVVVALGAVNAGQIYQCTCSDDPVVVGSSLLTFGLQSAVQTAQQSATSSSSLAIGTGSKIFAVPAGKSFAVGQWIIAVDTASIGTASQNVMFGQVSAYAGGNLTIAVVSTSGSGTHAAWTIALNNSAAAAGLAPPVGTGNVTGPGSAVDNNLPAFDGITGKLLKDSGVRAGALASRDTLKYGDAGTASIPAAALASDVLRGPIIGQPGNSENFLLANDATNPTRDVVVGSGRVEDDTFATKMRLKGAMVKRLDQAWVAGGVAGAPVGGTDAGGVKAASKTLHAYIIGKPGLSVTQFSRTSNVATLSIAAHGLGVGGTIDVQGVGFGFDGSNPITAVTTNSVSYSNTGADVGATAGAAVASAFDVLFSRQDANAYPAPAMPSGWTLKQCLGSVLTNGSGNVIAFTQVGDEFLLTSSIANITNTAPGDANAHLVALSVPLGVKMSAIVSFICSIGTRGYMSSPDQADEAPSSVGAPGASLMSSVAGGVRLDGVRTNTSGQVRYRLSGNDQISIITLGWRDARRRLF